MLELSPKNSLRFSPPCPRALWWTGLTCLSGKAPTSDFRRPSSTCVPKLDSQTSDSFRSAL